MIIAKIASLGNNALPVDLMNISGKQFHELTAKANAGDREALATLRDVLDASPAIDDLTANRRCRAAERSSTSGLGVRGQPGRPRIDPASD